VLRHHVHPVIRTPEDRHEHAGGFVRCTFTLCQ